MIFLLRNSDAATGKAHDIKMSASALTLGSNLTQHLHLPGSDIGDRHASITVVDGIARIKANSGYKIRVNGISTRTKQLQANDEIQIGKHRIKVIAAPEGFDFACKIITDSKKPNTTLLQSWHRQIKPARWTPRRLAYASAGLILVFALVLPYWAYRDGINFSLNQSWSDLMTAMTQNHEQSWRADSLWSPGPLLSAHQNAIGNNCTSCHTRAFTPVSDTTCNNCHNQSAQHFDEHFSNTRTTPSALQSLNPPPTQLTAKAMRLFSGETANIKPRCESCHKEHNEPQSIIATSDSLCTQCHRQPITGVDQSSVAATTAFNQSGHPQFRYTLLQAGLQKALDTAQSNPVQVQNPELVSTWNRIIQPADSIASEDSHLEFSHKIHMQLDEPTLSCSNCHQLDVDNEHFKPITMRDNCTDCHKLEFEGREIPHGDPALAIRSIEEYFIATYVTPGHEVDTPERRLPGRLEHVCQGSDYECAIEKAEQEIQAQFGASGCITCHRVTTIDNDPSAATPTLSPLRHSWQVEPVRLNNDWYANAQFDHASHLTQAGQTEIELCSTCHKAQQSDASSDILIPKIETCFGCHSDTSTNNKISVGCIDCHNNHPPKSDYVGINEDVTN